MTRELQITADGSHTVAVPELHSTYHSTFGAIQESRHVFIESGLSYVVQCCAAAKQPCAEVAQVGASVSKGRSVLSEACAVVSRHSADASQHCAVTAQSRATAEQGCAVTAQPGCIAEQAAIRIFEMGFGTGLNALLSFEEIRKQNRCVYYHAAELYPLSLDEAAQLNYISQLGNDALAPVFSLFHTSPWNKDVAIAPFFTLHKSSVSLLNIQETKRFHLIYFDAFAPAVQPDLWTEDVFTTMYNMLYKDGALVTYCAKGTVRRAMQSAGFTVEKLKGSPGKREMVRALKKD